MKEIYSVKCPKHIKWGDPLYFAEYKGEELERLVVDVLPSTRFSARVVLREEATENFPQYKNHIMAIYLAPDKNINTYMTDMMYEGQELTVKEIGDDTAEYYLMVDDKELNICTMADGYWGDYQALFRQIHGLKILDAMIITIVMPVDMTMEQMREYANYLFEDITQIENIEKNEEGQEMKQ